MIEHCKALCLPPMALHPPCHLQLLTSSSQIWYCPDYKSLLLATEIDLPSDTHSSPSRIPGLIMGHAEDLLPHAQCLHDSLRCYSAAWQDLTCRQIVGSNTSSMPKESMGKSSETANASRYYLYTSSGKPNCRDS